MWEGVIRMLKIMKYEVLRNKMTLATLGGVLALAELVFVYGIARGKSSTIGLGVVFLMLASGAAYFTIWLQGLTGFRRDLQEKTGYMLFLTPVSSYSVVIAKLMVALIELARTAGIVAFMAYIDLEMLRKKYERPVRIIETIANVLGVSVDDLWAAFVVVILTSMLSVLCLFSMAYFFSAVMAYKNSKLLGGRGGTVFLVIIVVFMYYFITLNLPTVSNNVRNAVVRGFIEKIPRHIFYVLGIIGCTWGTGHLLDKKISL